jgi:hypothetical protein
LSNVPVESKYYLKSVHAEIDLFDRRLAHLMKYDVFDTEAARAAAARKLTLKREPLVQTAKRLAAEGVEFKERPATVLPAGRNEGAGGREAGAGDGFRGVGARREPECAAAGFALCGHVAGLGEVGAELHAGQG